MYGTKGSSGFDVSSEPNFAKHNNFDLLRLILSLAVCSSHACVLSGNAVLESVSEWFHAAFAVRIFFAVSGFLISMSFERSRTLWAYFSKRLLRIYPAYVTTIFASALGFLFLSNLSVSEYFGAAWCRHVFANLFFLNFLEPNLPGVFSANPIQAVNGSLWTLKIECLFYVLVPLFSIWKDTRRSVLLTGVLYGSTVLISTFLRATYSRDGSFIVLQLDRQLFDLFAYFISGIFVHKMLPLFEPRRGVILWLGAVLLIVTLKLHLNTILPILLSTCILLLATSPALPSLKLKFDLSYGVYILHFPIVQALVHWGAAASSPVWFLLLTWMLTASLACLMWILVESPFIQMRSRIS